MTDTPDFDERLRRDFGGLREADALRAPDFGQLIARARADAVATPTAAAVTRRRIGPATRLLLFGAPLAAAAALALWLRPARAADREFEQAVAEWSRTTARTASSPTDGLLSVPGSEFLRGTPLDGTDAPPPRRGS